MRGKCFRKVPAICCCYCCRWCWWWGWQWGWDGSEMAAVPLSSVFACCELCSCVLLFLWSWFMAEFFIGGRSGWPVTSAAWSLCREPANSLDTITYRCSRCHWHAQTKDTRSTDTDKDADTFCSYIYSLPSTDRHALWSLPDAVLFNINWPIWWCPFTCQEKFLRILFLIFM